MPTAAPTTPPRCVAIVSGGLDSVTMAHWLRRQGYALDILTFDYGQRHRKEITFAQRCAEGLGARWQLVRMDFLADLLPGSSLTDPTVAVPDGHYAADNMRLTVVPNRNTILLAVAFAYAAAHGAQAVAYAAHGGDHYIYPDCRPEFVSAFAHMQRAALGEMWSIELLAPFLHLSKADIVRLGHQLGVDFAQTWSCYKGEAVHCGRCGTCVERKEAFQKSGVPDPTVYAA